jgi:hypothetical protein
MLPGETYFLDVARAVHQRVDTESATALRAR